MKTFLAILALAFTGCATAQTDRAPSSTTAAPIAVVGTSFRETAVELLQDYKDHQNGNTGWLYTLEKGLHAYSSVTKTYADAKTVLKDFTATKGQPWVDRFLSLLQTKPDVPLETKMSALATLSDHVAADKGP